MARELMGSTALAAILAAAVASNANAADLAPKSVEPLAPVVAAPYDWSGFYVGVHAGWGWGREHDNMSRLSEGGLSGGGGTAPPPSNPLPPTADHFGLSGFVGGAHLGYNYQIGQLVIGPEVDFDYAGLSGSHAFSGTFQGTPLSGVLKLRTDWQGSARVRAGYAIDNLLLYATGGLAFANAKLEVNGVGDSNTHVGWTAGAGLEYAFTQNWIGRVEVRYSDFEKKGYDTPVGKIKADFDETTTELGISYKF